MYYTYTNIKGLCQQVFIYNEETLVYIIYIMCPSGHLTSARFEHFMCHRYIWYIFSLVCSVFVIQYIYHIMNMFNQVQWWKKYLSKEYVSLNIKHTSSWRNKSVVYIYKKTENVHFSYSLLPKIWKLKIEVGFSYKYCIYNQFLLLKNYSIDYGIE